MMKYYENEAPRSGHSRSFLAYPLLIAVLSVTSIAATFLLGQTSAGVTVKTLGFSWIGGMFLIVCTGLHLLPAMKISRTGLRFEVSRAEWLEVRFDQLFESINEIDELFAGSLGLADSFRLITARIREAMPVAAIELLLLDETRSHLQIAASDGALPTPGKQKDKAFDEGLPGRCYSSREVVTEGSSVAVPLRRNEQVFGVLRL